MNLLNHILCSFLSSELLPTLMQNIGLAFVTMLIPLVLFIFSMEKEALFEWDKIVILDKVIKAKYLLISIGLIFSPLFIWNYDSNILKFILFLLFLCGVVYLIHILFNSYRWIKTVEIIGHHDSNNFRNILRNNYLAEVTNLEEKEKVWSLTWRKDIENTLDERNLIKKFIINIDALINNDSLDILGRYLQTFSEFIDKRAIYDVVIFNEFFQKLLEWDFSFFQKEQKEREVGGERWYTIFEIEANLTRLINKFVLSSLLKSNSFALFRNLKEGIQNKDVNFLKKLFSQSICRIIFDNVADSNDLYNIWNHYFPKEWKITIKTLEDTHNIISKIWCHEFFQWGPNRFLSTEREKDFYKNLDEVAKELFPSVEPILWANILTFIFMRPWVNNDRIKPWIEREPNFGMMGRMFSSWGSNDQTRDEFNVEFDKSMDEQRHETIELLLFLFENTFTKEKLESLIIDLQRLKYGDDTREGSRRKEFISIFEKMISLIESKEYKPA